MPMRFRGVDRRFPRWPHEPAAFDLVQWLLDRLADVAGEPPMRAEPMM